MAADERGNEPAGRDEPDPFDGLVLDEEFVRRAEVLEESAEARLARQARIEAEHRRLEAERAVESESIDRRLRRQARRRRRSVGSRAQLQRLVVIAVMVAVFGGLTYWNLRDQGGQLVLGAPSLLSNDVSSDVVVTSNRPPAGVDAASEPLGSPAPLAAESDSYAFMHTQPGDREPVAYDPCRPVHVVLNERTAMPEGRAIVEDALAAASQATGLQFVIVGPTDEAFSAERAAYQPERYGERWAPVLIAWSDPEETRELAGDVAGLGGSAVLVDGDGAVLVTGSVALDGPAMADLLLLPGGRTAVQAVVEHELGHLLGLDHVDDPSQLMDDTNRGTVTTYAAGDLTGLARLGRGACFPSV